MFVKKLNNQNSKIKKNQAIVEFIIKGIKKHILDFYRVKPMKSKKKRKNCNKKIQFLQERGLKKIIGT